VGTGRDDARGGVEGEREAFEGGGCGCGEVEDEFVCGAGDAKIRGLTPGIRIETWGTQVFVRKCGEVGLGGGPGGLEKAGVGWVDLALCGDGRGGEEVQLLPGSGAGDVEETLALGGLAGAMDGVEPVVEGTRWLTATGDGGEHDVRCGIDFRLVDRVEFGPGEEAGAIVGRVAFEGRDEDDIPLESLSLVDREQLDEGLAGRDGGRFGKEFLQVGFEEGGIEEGGGGVFFQLRIQFVE
jgi:hypothetical protein